MIKSSIRGTRGTVKTQSEFDLRELLVLGGVDMLVRTLQHELFRSARVAVRAGISCPRQMGLFSGASSFHVRGWENRTSSWVGKWSSRALATSRDSSFALSARLAAKVEASRSGGDISQSG